MTEMTTSLRLSLENSQFRRGLRDSGRDIDQFAGRTDRSMRQADRSISGFVRRSKKELSDLNRMTGGAFGNIRNEVLAIGTAWATLKLSKDSAHLDKQLTRLAQTAGVARDNTKELRAQLFNLQKDDGTQVDKMLGGYEKLIQMGLSWKSAMGVGSSISAASSITGASPSAIASGVGVAAKVYGYDLSDKAISQKLIDQFLKATDFGAVEFEDLASTFGRVGVNAKAANLSLTQTIALTEALSSVEANPERLSTMLDSGLRIFNNGQYRDQVSKTTGIKFFGQDGSARDTLQVLKDLSSKYKEYGTTEDRKANFVNVVFKGMDLDTQKFMRAVLAGELLQETETFNLKLMKSMGETARRQKEATDNAEDSVSRLKGALGKAADAFVKPINNGISSLIQYALDSKNKGGLGLDGTDLLLGGAGVLAGGAAAYKYGGPGIRKLLGKGGQLAGGVAAGKALEAAAGVTPVYVVNMPSGFGGGGSVVDDVLDLGRRGRRGGGMRGGRLPRLPGPGGYSALPGSNPLTGFGIRNVLNDYAANGLGRLLGGIGLNASVLGGSVGAAGLGAAATGVGVAGAAGYGAGTLIHRSLIKGTDLEMDIGRAIAKALALFGNENARASLASEERAQASLKIELDDKRAKISQIQSRGMDVDVSGSSMGSR